MSVRRGAVDDSAELSACDGFAHRHAMKRRAGSVRSAAMSLGAVLLLVVTACGAPSAPTAPSSAGGSNDRGGQASTPAVSTMSLEQEFNLAAERYARMEALLSEA